MHTCESERASESERESPKHEAQAIDCLCSRTRPNTHTHTHTELVPEARDGGDRMEVQVLLLRCVLVLLGHHTLLR